MKPKGPRIFDSWALLAFFQGKANAASKVEEFLLNVLHSDRKKLYLHRVSWTELYATIQKAAGPAEAADTVSFLEQLPIEIVETDDREISRQAAILKATYGLSLGASFAAALTKQKKGQLVTGDPQLLALRPAMTLDWLGDPALLAENSPQ